MPAFNYELASTVLVEAAYQGDKVTAKKYGITERTIRNYRKRLDEDKRLSAFFQDKKERMEQRWADELPGAIRAAINYLQGAAQDADRRNPDAIHAVAGALKILSDVALTKEVLDARLARQHRSQDETD